MDLRSLIADLKRRHVLRVAWLYGVVAFVGLQAFDLLFSALLVPDWAFRAVALAMLAGFPIALVLAWAYDITPSGVRRTEPAEEAPALLPLPPPGRFDPRRLAFVGVGILVALVGFGLSAPYLRVSAADPAEAELSRSIAVLPFSSLATGADDAVFAEGLMEDIISSLSNVPGLHVMSRTTAMTYRGTDKSVRLIGREQGVGTVLTGVVRRVDSRVRVTVQLVDARTDENLWAETFDRELTDVFKVQTEIAQYIAAALQARLSPEDAVAPERRVEAARYAAKGREYLMRAGTHHIETSIALYQEALGIDPASPTALAGLAEAFLARATHAGPQWVDSAEASAHAALAADAPPAIAHGALGRVRLAQGRPADALPALERATTMDPQDPWLRLAQAEALREVGRLGAALAAAEVGALSAPGEGRYAAAVAEIALLLGDTTRARQQGQAALDAAEPEPVAARTLALVALMGGDAAAARDAVETLLRGGGQEPHLLLAAGRLELLLGDDAAALDHLEAALAAMPQADAGARVDLALAWRRLGGTDQADALLAEGVSALEARLGAGDRSSATLYQLARAHAAAGRPDEALVQLHSAVERGLRGPLPVALDPAFERLRTLPAFTALLERL